MRDNPEGGKIDPAVDDRRRCKNNSPSVYSAMDKRAKEGCGRGSEAGTVHSGQSLEGPVPLRKLKKSGKKEIQLLAQPSIEGLRR